MHQTSRWHSVLIVASLTAAVAAQRSPTFAETWALAPDRSKVLATLLPGSNDWFYYRCRERLDAGDFAAVDAVLAEWRAAPGLDPDRQSEIQNRRALLAYDEDPAAAFAWLRQKLGLTFDDAPPQGAAPELPVELDPQLLDRERMLEHALSVHGGRLHGCTADALPWLAVRTLTDVQVGDVLDLAGKARRPALPNIAALVVRDLAGSAERRFGSRTVHEQLRLEQLAECAALWPSLLRDEAFVAAYVARLQPEPFAAEPRARGEQLARVWEFVQRLGPAHDALKSHVLFHWLQHDLAAGAPDKARFLAWLQLPRRDAWAVPPASASLHVPATRSCPFCRDEHAGDGEQLARRCLEHFLATEDDARHYSPYVQQQWLHRVLAETKLMAGHRDAQRWHALLGSPELSQALEQRTEIRFASTLPRRFAARDRVVLEVDTKNVATLLLRVHALDTFRWYRGQQKEIPLDLDVDGLIASHERTITIAAPPIRRVRHRFELPELDGPGTWIVECIGRGLRSRALIHKGDLRCVRAVTARGTTFRVFDEDGAPVPDAAIWYGDRDFTAGADGEIVLPFAAEAGEKTVVLHRGERAALATTVLAAEQYSLAAPCFVDRQALIAGAQARLLVRPRLCVCDCELPIGRLRDVTLTLVAKDLDGVETVDVVRDVQLAPDRELVHELRVPDRLRSLAAMLDGVVQATDGTKVPVAGRRVELDVNGVDDTAATASGCLLRTERGWVFELRGKSGEPKAGRPVTFRFEHADFEHKVRVQLRTDDTGRIVLGPLAGVREVAVERGGGSGAGSDVIRLPRAAWHVPQQLHGLADDTLRLPYAGDAAAPSRDELSLLGEHHDEFARLAINGGQLELRGLPEGEYELRCHRTATTVRVHVRAGVRRGDWLIGRDHALQAASREPLHVRGLELAGDGLRVAIGNATPRTRVHVVATRLLPATSPGDALAVARDPLEAFELPYETTSVATDVALDDEVRYVLERRFAPKFPGNMLVRPSLLVHRLDLELTAGFERGRRPGGSKYGSRFGRGSGPGGAGGRVNDRRTPDPTAFANLDWLPRPSVTLANLVPDRDGVVQVPAAELGDGQLVRVVAVDGDATAERTLVRAEQPLVPRDRTLRQPLDGTADLAGSKAMHGTAARADGAAADPRDAKVTLLDSLARLHDLLLAWGADRDLSAFGFVLDWPPHTPAVKSRLYAEHACHELNVFLYQKDRAFFDAVVRPGLAVKRQPTFVDRWLLGDDLTPFAAPSAFARLNVVERALLARRLGGAQRDAIARSLRDMVQQRPADELRTSGRLDVAIAANDLERTQAPAIVDRDEVPELREQDVAPSDVDLSFEPQRPTRLYAEHDWWHRRVDQATPDVVAANRFWLDLANAPGDRPFLSPAVVEIGDTFLESMMALAALDVPFAAGPATPLLVARAGIAPAERAAAAEPLVLGQHILRLDDPVRDDGGEWRDAYVTGELLTDVAYACRVLVTNPSSRPRTASVLLQVPTGAVPVQKGFWTKDRLVQLKPYATVPIEYAFYFPAAGDFAHFPATVAENGKVVAKAEARMLRAVVTPAKVDLTSWDDVARHGTSADVLAFLDAHNVRQLDLDRIAWRLRDRAFFDAVIGELRERFVHSQAVWSWALLHGDAAAAREYLEHDEAFVRACGPALRSPLLTIDPIRRGTYQHLELDPFVRGRVHARAADTADPDEAELDKQYAALLALLGCQRSLSSEDWLAVAYYQLLQDRVAEGLASFAKVERAQVRETMQYDYLAAYACFFTRDVARARGIAEPYRDFPIDHWRLRFRDVLAQLDEVEGRAAASISDRPPTNDSLAAQAPSLELALDGSKLTLRTRHLARCEVRYYVLDVEFAFSARPFTGSDGTSAAFVQPARRDVLDVPDGGELTLELPAQFHRQNVLIEARGGGLLRAQTWFANALAVRFHEAWGQLGVSAKDTGAPLPQTYVKVFEQLPGGGARFHKDGYTDLRGRFDYVAVTDGGGARARRFAVLVLHEERGAVIREVDAPAR